MVNGFFTTLEQIPEAGINVIDRAVERSSGYKRDGQGHGNQNQPGTVQPAAFHAHCGYNKAKFAVIGQRYGGKQGRPGTKVKPAQHGIKQPAFKNDE